MKKILLITHQPPPCKGGTAKILYRLFKMLPKNSYVILTTYSQFASRHRKFIDTKMRMSCKYYFSQGICPGTPYTRWIALLEYFILPFMFLKCLYVIKKENIDRILVHPITGTFLLTACFIHRITGIPLYIYMFDLFEEQMDKKSIRGIMAGPVERLTMRTATNVFVMSERLQEHYFKKYNRRTVLLPHPIDLKGKVVRQKISLVKSEAKYKILLTAGMIYNAHIDTIKNLILAIRGMPEIEFNIYTLNTNEYLKKYGINGSNVVYSGYVASKNIYIIQKKADILFLPMAFQHPFPELIRTASPGKLPEYLASDTPILVHAPPEAYISWYAQKYGWGMVVDKPNPKLLKIAILKLLGDKKLQQDLIKNARETVLFHDIDQVFKIFKKGLGIS